MLDELHPHVAFEEIEKLPEWQHDIREYKPLPHFELVAVLDVALRPELLLEGVDG